MTSATEHGTVKAYCDGCRCTVCSAGHRRRCKDYRLRSVRLGGATTVDATESQAILAEAASRMSLSAIGRHLGTSHTWVARVIRGDIQRVAVARAGQIAATLDGHDPTDTSHVAVTGTRRRLQALHALGYTWRHLADETGYSLTGLKGVIYGREHVVEARNAQRVREVYDRLSMTIPVGSDSHARGAILKAQRNAARRGWPPPLAWDDIDRDPAPAILHTVEPAGVDEVTVARILAGERLPCTHAERLEVLRRAPAAGRSLNSLERQMGWNSTREKKRIAA